MPAGESITNKSEKQAWDFFLSLQKGTKIRLIAHAKVTIESLAHKLHRDPDFRQGCVSVCKVVMPNENCRKHYNGFSRLLICRFSGVLCLLAWAPCAEPIKKGHYRITPDSHIALNGRA